MEKQVEINGETILYNLNQSSRARRVRITIHGDGSITVTIPRGFREYHADKFLLEKADWIIKKIKVARHSPYDKKIKRLGREDYLKHKDRALGLAEERLEYFNQFYNFSFDRISIRDQKTRWGSCSRKGNLNFNFKILFLSEEMRDYIIAHELCHLGELNHSPRFWKLVERTIPGYKQIRRELRKNSLCYL